MSGSTEVLAYNELKRYYIRRVCQLAIAQEKLLQICRISSSKNPSSDADNFIGEILHSGSMLNVARNFPKNSKESSSARELRVLRPNSGLCVKILDKEQNLSRKGEING